LENLDCGTQGTCIDNGGTTAPTKQCYCNAGWFGPGCAKSKFPFDNFSCADDRFWDTYAVPPISQYRHPVVIEKKEKYFGTLILLMLNKKMRYD